MKDIKYYNTKYYRMLLKTAMNKLEKEGLEGKSKERQKGNYEYAVRCFCRYLASTEFDMDTYVIYSVSDYQVREFFREEIGKILPDDIKKAVLLGKMVDILNQLLAKDVYIMDLWKHREVRCSCGAACNLITAQFAYSPEAVKVQHLIGRYYYRCPICGAQVGTHIGTNIPYGTPVNKNTAKVRQDAHLLIDDVINQNEGMDKTDVYQYLSKRFQNLDKEKVHIGLFDYATCKEAVSILTGFGNTAKSVT